MAVRKKRVRRRKKRYHTGTYVSTKTGQACKYRSGWELEYLKWLDAHLMVRTFGYESVKIPYVSNLRTGKLRNYFPDFLVEFTDGSKQLVEIKPSKRLVQAGVKKKLEAAERWCQAHGVSLVVLTERELKVMGLL
jgi:hypothetical protein